MERKSEMPLPRHSEWNRSHFESLAMLGPPIVIKILKQKPTWVAEAGGKTLP